MLFIPRLPITGQAIFAYVSLLLGSEPTDELGQELREHVADMIGKFARPKQVMFTPDLPKTRSGKIMRRLLRDIAEQRDLGDVTTLRDPGVVAKLCDSVPLGVRWAKLKCTSCTPSVTP